MNSRDTLNACLTVAIFGMVLIVFFTLIHRMTTQPIVIQYTVSQEMVREAAERILER